MAYTINKFDGSLLTSVADGTIDTAATDIKLVGKNFTGYGEIINENYVHMLENFASTTAPTTPMVGQIWWNTTLGTLTVYDGTQFKAVSSSTVSASEPSGAVEGDLWWDSDDEQLFVYNGTSWVLVGPAASALVGQSGSIVEIITDSGATDHVVVSTYVADTRVAITSSDATFTPDGVTPADLAPEFPGNIEPGINLAADAAITGIRYQGTATNADQLDNLDSTQFLRSDEADATTGTLSITNDSGLFVGLGSDLQLNVAGDGLTSQIYGRVVSSNLIIGATDAASANIAAFTIDPDAETISLANGGAGAGVSRIINMGDPTGAQDAVTLSYLNTQINESGGGPVFRDGTNTITGVITPSGTGTIDFGTTGLRFATIYAGTFDGTSTQANYADLAERFHADTQLEPGTVVMLGGPEEITRVNEELSDDIFGVISTNPAHLMNSKAGDNETHPPVAMAGRVPVRVIGTVKKGDRLVSAGNGLARAATKDELTSFNVIGRALEAKTDTGEGTVEAIVQMNS
jgi:hypothetical protein